MAKLNQRDVTTNSLVKAFLILSCYVSHSDSGEEEEGKHTLF